MRGFVALSVYICVAIYMEKSKAYVVDTRPWTAPCTQRSTGQSVNIFASRFQMPLRYRLHKVKIHTGELADLLQEQFQEYLSVNQELLPHERILTFPLAGFPVSGAIDNDTLHISEMENYIEEDYIGLSKLWVFIEQANLDAASNQSTDMSTIVSHYNEITSKLRKILCELSKLLGGRFSSLGHVNRDIMSENLRNVRGSYEEFTRDFSILRNAISYVSTLSQNYGLFQRINN